MRTHLFVVAFILLQCFMILCVLTGLADPRSNDANGFFWFLIVAVMLVIQPLRGFNSLSDEHRLNTLELIQLTRLDSWRITLGKWTALNAQGLLFLIGVLPYVALRYFVGSVDLLQDAAGIGMIALGSALFTAITIGCSVFPNLILRGILLCVFTVLGIGLISTFGVAVVGRRSALPDPAAGILLILAVLYGTFFFLSFGASRIAPLSQNLATRKRLVAVGFALLFQIFWWFGLEEEVIAATGIVLGLACIDALTEPLPIFTRVTVPFRKNILLRFAGLILCPGWLSGILFYLFSVALWFGCFFLGLSVTGDSTPNSPGDWVIVISVCNVLIFPLPILHLFFAKHSSTSFTFGLYLFAQAALFGITLMTMALAKATGKWEDEIYLALPLPSVFIAANMGSDADEMIHVVIALIVGFICVVFPILRQPRVSREFLRQLWKSS